VVWRALPLLIMVAWTGRAVAQSIDWTGLALVHRDQADRWRIVVRDPSASRPRELTPAGTPRDPEWVDSNRIGYRITTDASDPEETYVVQDLRDGRVTATLHGHNFSWSPGGRRVACRVGRPGREQLAVDGRRVWPRQGQGESARLASDTSWSRDGSGFAFIEGSPGWPRRLVVVLDPTDAGGDLTWDLPHAAPSGLKVFWAGPSRVVVGKSTFEPSFEVEWQATRVPSR
jgi:hypothetical protein